MGFFCRIKQSINLIRILRCDVKYLNFNNLNKQIEKKNYFVFAACLATRNMHSVICHRLNEARISVTRFPPSGGALINTALQFRQTDMSKCTVTFMSMKNNMVACVGGGVNSVQFFEYPSGISGCFTTR